MKNTRYYQMFVDFYTFMKDHYPPTRSEQYFDQLIDDGDALGAKYNNDKFVSRVVVAIMRELESVAIQRDGDPGKETL